MAKSLTRASASQQRDRIEHIADLMSKGRWVTRLTAKQLADDWGLSKTTVEHMASEASRSLKLDRGTTSRQRDEQLAKLEAIASICIGQKKYRDAVAAILAMSRIAGTDSPDLVDAAEHDHRLAMAMRDAVGECESCTAKLRQILERPEWVDVKQLEERRAAAEREEDDG